MSNFKKISFSDILKRLKKIHFTFGQDADCDWAFICYTFFVLFIASIVCGVFMFISVSSYENINENSSLDSSALINKKALSSLLEKYEKRGVFFDSLLLKNPDIIDPSR